ncbi:hypothetical protein ACFXKJ_12240 [Kitasatospora indigofera]|uniref:hypothetical protein n=2 Tax=Kitasatospora indigofera TaxID=67307 RepID=UPI0036452A8B
MQMTPVYQAAINGTLASQEGGGGTGNPLVFSNQTFIPLTMYALQPGTGERLGWDGTTFSPGQPGYVIPAGGTSMTQADPTAGWYFLFTAAYSGAFVAVFETPESGDVTITNYAVLEPNDIGKFPKPSADVVIPTDSPRIVVGCGLLPNGNTVIREQLWQRLPDSYSIAPGQTKEVNFSVTSGVQSSSSDLSTLEKSVAATAKAGWGPVSASVSASLSSASTTFQQVTATKQTTSFVSHRFELRADAPAPETTFYWQLADCVTVYDTDGVSLSSLLVGTQPALIGGPYRLRTEPVTSGGPHRQENGGTFS